MSFWQTVGERIRKDVRTYGAAVLLAAVLLLVCTIFGKTTCPSVIVLGMPCPGCGMTRAILCLLTGRLEMAWKMNPAVFPLAAWLFFFLVERYVFGKTGKGVKAGIVMVLLFMVFCYIVRMWRYFPEREPYVYCPDNLLQRLLGRAHPYYDLFQGK